MSELCVMCDGWAGDDLLCVNCKPKRPVTAADLRGLVTDPRWGEGHNRDSLDDAWAEAGAFPGWRVTGVQEHAEGGWVAIAHCPYLPRAMTEGGRGPTPAAALRALAAKLREAKG